MNKHEITKDKKQLIEGKDIFKGGVIIRNPEKLEETMRRHYEKMFYLYNTNRSVFKQWQKLSMNKIKDFVN